MSYGERHTWAYLTTAVVVAVAYLAYTLTRLAGADPADLDFQRPLLIAVGAGILANMFAAPPPRKGRDRTDERDTDIGRRGERIGFIVLGAAVTVPLALALLEADPFWIANAIYLAYVAATVASSAVKLVLYRRGA